MALAAGAPAILLILAFLRTPAPADATEATLANPAEAAAAFRFFSIKILFARDTVSVKTGSAGGSAAFAAPPCLPLPEGLLLSPAGLGPAGFGFDETEAFARSGTGLGERLFGSFSLTPRVVAVGGVRSCLRYRL